MNPLDKMIVEIQREHRKCSCDGQARRDLAYLISLCLLLRKQRNEEVKLGNPNATSGDLERWGYDDDDEAIIKARRS